MGRRFHFIPPIHRSCCRKGNSVMSLTIQAVVCTLDFSPYSPLVVRHGVALARRAGARLYLIHAVHDPQDGVHPTTLFERGGDLAQVTEAARERMHALMAHTTLDWEAVVRFGEPVEQTALFVNTLPPSLVVSASHGISGFRRLFVGTVVERMTRSLSRPMLVVKHAVGDEGDRIDGFRSILISCDGEGYWRQLAPVLPLLQGDANSRIRLVHALEAPMRDMTTDSDATSYNTLQQDLQDRIHRRLREQALEVFSHADRLDFEVAPGVPQEMVLSQASRCASDLIVVGVRHSGKMGRWISGSTTESLLRRAPCCVLTLPEPLKRAKNRERRR